MTSDTIPLLATLSRLWDDVYDVVRRFPKLDKHLLGARLLDDLDACTHHVLLALNDRPHRAAHLTACSVAFDHWKIRLRIAVHRGLVSERWYGTHLDVIAEIGKMIGGWQRSPPPTP